MEGKLDGHLRGPRSLLCWPVCLWWVRHTLSSHRLLASESQPHPQIWIHLQNSRKRSHISPANSLWMVFEEMSMIDQRALPCSFLALPLSPLATALIQTLFISLVYSCSNLVPGLYDSVLHIPSLSTTLLLVISF